MRTILFCLLIILLSLSTIHSQIQPPGIPNRDFEYWTEGLPDNWYANNIDPSIITLTQTTDANSGESAAKMEVGSIFDTSVGPVLFVGTPDQPGFAVSQKYSSLSGWYKYNPDQGDQLSVIVTMSYDGITIGEGVLDISEAASTYTRFLIDLEYIGDNTPDKCHLVFAIINQDGSQAPHLDSYAVIDNLEFLPSQIGTSVEPLSAPYQYDLGQNYPNPFNPSTIINYSVPKQSYVDLVVFDAIGNEIVKLVHSEKSAGNYNIEFNAADYPSGIYFYQLRAKNFSMIKKMILLK